MQSLLRSEASPATNVRRLGGRAAPSEGATVWQHKQGSNGVGVASACTAFFWSSRPLHRIRRARSTAASAASVPHVQPHPSHSLYSEVLGKWFSYSLASWRQRAAAPRARRWQLAERPAQVRSPCVQSCSSLSSRPKLREIVVTFVCASGCALQGWAASEPPRAHRPCQRRAFSGL